MRFKPAELFCFVFWNVCVLRQHEEAIAQTLQHTSNSSKRKLLIIIIVLATVIIILLLTLITRREEVNRTVLPNI